MSRLFLLIFCALWPLAAIAQPKTFDFSAPSDAAIAVPYAVPGGVAASVDVKIENGALVFLNRAGGSFGVQLKITPLDLAQISHLSFDYALSGDAKVNIFLKVNGKYHAVFFSGPKRVRPGTTVLGDLKIAALTGRVEIPLREWLGVSSGTVEEILIGNWDNGGYALAGIGGNGPGAKWSLDNLKLEKRAQKPVFGAAHWVGDELEIPARDLGDFDFGNIVLRFNDRDWVSDGGAFRFAGGRGFVWNARIAGQSFADGANLPWELKRGAQILTSGTVRLDFSGQIEKTLALPNLNFQGADDLGEDFETGESLKWGGNAIRELQNADGNGFLRLSNPRTTSEFSLQRPTAWDAAKNPLLSFAYRADDRLRVDLNLVWEAKTYGVRFTDRDNPNPILGAIPDVQTDGKWHLASVPLLEWMKKLRPDATNFKIDSFSFQDSAWGGNVKGLQWDLDDWRAAPRVSGVLKAQLAMRDVTGERGASYILDQNPQTLADENAQSGAQIEIPLGDKKGVWWLHVRARNGAGKWSQTAHFPVFVE